MDISLFIPLILSFFISLIFMPLWIKKAHNIGLVWDDMNKYKKEEVSNKTKSTKKEMKSSVKEVSNIDNSNTSNQAKSIIKVAGSGGIVVVMAFIIAVLSYIALKTYLLDPKQVNTIEIFALLTTVILASFIGFIDDLFGWVHGGLSMQLRILLIGICSIPLMVINAGSGYINIPFDGYIDLGNFYGLIIIPIGVIGCTTTFNFLAGFNGLEAGQSITIITSLSIISYILNLPWISVIGLCMVCALIPFWFFNKFPAKVFPGDVLTYSVGALIVSMTILGSFEKVSILIFSLYIIEVILKLRGGLKKSSFGKPTPNNTLELKYNKIYGLEHLAIYLINKLKGNAKEYEVVISINSMQIFICIIVILGLQFSNY